MAVENARVRPRVVENRSIEISQLGIDRRHCRDRVAFAQHEEILTAAGRIGDVDIDEAAVIQRDEGDCRRKCSAGMKTLVDGCPALFQREQPYVGIFDGQQLQDALAKEVIVCRRGRSHAESPAQCFRPGVHRGRLIAIQNRRVHSLGQRSTTTFS